MSEPMSDERLEQIRKTWGARRVFEWVGTNLPMESTHPEVVEVLDLLDEVERLRKAPTITDEMIERAAIQMCATDRQSSIWPILTEAEREDFRADARTVLTAAFGGSTAHREDETTGHTPTGAGLWRRIPDLLATLAEARTEAQDLREQLAPARDFLAVAS